MKNFCLNIIKKYNLNIIPFNINDLILVRNLSELKLNEKYVIGILMVNIGSNIKIGDIEIINTYVNFVDVNFKQHHIINKHIYQNKIDLKLIYKPKF